MGDKHGATSQSTTAFSGVNKVREKLSPHQQLVWDQIWNLFRKIPGHVSMTYAHLLHTQNKRVSPKVATKVSYDEFEFIFLQAQTAWRTNRRFDVRRRRNKKRNHMLLNTGYEEPEDVYDAE